MSARGVDCIGVTFVGGSPVFAFACDCGIVTAVVVEALAADDPTETLEFAFTCDGCISNHWVTVSRVAAQ